MILLHTIFNSVHTDSPVQNLLDLSRGQVDSVEVKKAPTRKKDNKKGAELLLRNDVWTLQLQAGVEVRWGQTGQAAGMKCVAAPDRPQPHKHHSVPKRCK